MMKDLSRVALAVGLMVAASGCASGPRGESAAGPTEPEPSSAQPAEAKASPDDDGVFTATVSRSALREQALQLLTEAAVAPEPLLRANALEGLQSAPGRVEDPVRAGLSDENPGVRFVAAMTVGQLKLKRSRAFVEPLTGDADQRVRAAAIYALQAIGQPVDPSPLAEMLLQDDVYIRSEAARILGELRNSSAIPMLKAAAATADSRNRARSSGFDDRLLQMERVFQLQVAEALVKLGDPESIHAIRAALYPGGREGFESAALAAQMLGGLGDQKSAAQLVQLVEQKVTDPDDPRSKQREPEYRQPKEVRLAAAGSLALLGYRDGMYVARAYLEDPDAVIRAQAAYVFGLGRGRESLGFLERAMQDRSPLVRVSAAAAVLKTLGGV